MADWSDILKILVPVLGAIFSIAIRAMWKKLKIIQEEHLEATNNIKLILDALKDPTDPKGKRILHRSEILAALTTLHQIVDGRCGNAHCPVVPVITQKVKEIDEKITNFYQKGEEDRKRFFNKTEEMLKQITHMVEQIFERINSFIDDFAGKVLLAITQQPKNRKKNDEGE